MTDLTVTPAVPTTRPADRRIDIRTAIDQYRTCELATLSRNGVPIAWPAVFDWDPATDRIVLTTSISFPQKAFNIRRDPRVALLFSDPTGTGRTDLPQILVRGTAGCPEQIHPGTAGLERYWQRLAQRQPASRTYSANRFSRRLFDWYYLRLVITVTPVEVSTAPAANGRPMGGAAVATPADGGAWARLAQELPGFSGAVLGTAADGELPVLRRVRLTPAPGSGAFLVDDPGPALTAGPASVLLHRHDDLLWNQRQIGAVGQLVRSGAGTWMFRPDRMLPTMFPANAVEMARVVIRARRTANRYLQRRGLDRPAIDWAAHRACEQPGAQ